jgi:hypothetical protein
LKESFEIWDGVQAEVEDSFGIGRYVAHSLAALLSKALVGAYL